MCAHCQARKRSIGKRVIKSTGIEISTIGKRHLGAALGSEAFKKEFAQEKVDEWIAQIKVLSKFAVTQQHAAFSAFTHRLQGRWTFVSRTVPEAGPLLSGLEKAIREDFVPALLGRNVSDLERDLLSLPARYGGMGISNPCSLAPIAYDFSRALCAPLMHIVLRQGEEFDPNSLREDQNNIKLEGDKETARSKGLLLD